MISRMKQTLARNRAPSISGSELREDWLLLKKIDDGGTDELDHEAGAWEIFRDIGNGNHSWD